MAQALQEVPCPPRGNGLRSQCKRPRVGVAVGALESYAAAHAGDGIDDQSDEVSHGCVSSLVRWAVRVWEESGAGTGDGAT